MRHPLIRFQPLRYASGLVAGLVAAGCGPDTKQSSDDSSGAPVDEPSTMAARYAKVACGAVATCGCASHYATDAACEAALASRFDELTAGYTLVEAAFEAVLDHDPCVRTDAWSATESITVGTKGKGETCRGLGELPLLVVDECGSELTCISGVCSDGDLDTTPPMEGGACDRRSDPSCGFSPWYCASDGTCRARLELGSVCDSPSACGGEGVDPAFCRGAHSGSGVCTETIGLGEACDPLEFSSCKIIVVDDVSARFAICDPATRTCRDELPRKACGDFGFFRAWPEPPEN